MASVNKVILVGHLTHDPSLKHSAQQEAIGQFSLATNETWKDKQGHKQQRVEYHSIVLYRRLAEVASTYLKKGSLVYLEGRIHTRKWQDKAGQDRYSTEIIAEQMQMLNKQRTEGDQSSSHQDEDDTFIPF